MEHLSQTETRWHLLCYSLTGFFALIMRKNVSVEHLARAGHFYRWSMYNTKTWSPRTHYYYVVCRIFVSYCDKKKCLPLIHDVFALMCCDEVFALRTLSECVCITFVPHWDKMTSRYTPITLDIVLKGGFCIYNVRMCLRDICPPLVQYDN